MWDKGYIPCQRAAEVLCVHYTTVYKWCKRGDLEAVRLNRHWYIRRSSLFCKLRDRNPHQSPEYVAELLGIEAVGECEVCAVEVSIDRKRCDWCIPLEENE